MLAFTAHQAVLVGGLGGLAYLLVIGLVAALLTALFGDEPLIVAFGAIFWPALLIPMLCVVAGYRIAGGRKIDGGG
jgi:hypothetical protein